MHMRTPEKEVKKHPKESVKTHRISVQRLEVKIVVGDANVTRVCHQRRDHFRLTLHVWAFGHVLKTAHKRYIPTGPRQSEHCDI